MEADGQPPATRPRAQSEASVNPPTQDAAGPDGAGGTTQRARASSVPVSVGNTGTPAVRPGLATRESRFKPAIPLPMDQPEIPPQKPPPELQAAELQQGANQLLQMTGQANVQFSQIELLAPSVTTQLQDFCSLAVNHMKVFVPALEKVQQQILGLGDDLSKVSSHVAQVDDRAKIQHEKACSQMSALEDRVRSMEAFVQAMPVWREDLLTKIADVANCEGLHHQQTLARFNKIEQDTKANMAAVNERLDYLSEMAANTQKFRDSTVERIGHMQEEVGSLQKLLNAKMHHVEQQFIKVSWEQDQAQKRDEELSIRTATVAAEAERNLNGRMEPISAMLFKLQTELSVVQASNDRVFGSLDRIGIKLDDHTRTIDDSRRRLEGLENDTNTAALASLRARFDHLLSNWDQYQTTMASKFNDLDAKVTDMEVKSNKAPPGVQKLQVQLEEALMQIKQDTGALQAANSSIQNLQDSLVQAQEALQRQQQLVNQLATQSEENTRRLVADNKRLVSYTEERLDAMVRKYELNAVVQELDTAKTQLTRYIDQTCGNMKADVLQQITGSGALMDGATDLQSAFRNIEKTSQKLNERLSTLELVMKAQDERSSALNMQLHDAYVQLQQASAAALEADRRLTSLQNSNLHADDVAKLRAEFVTLKVSVEQMKRSMLLNHLTFGSPPGTPSAHDTRHSTTTFEQDVAYEAVSRTPSYATRAISTSHGHPTSPNQIAPMDGPRTAFSSVTAQGASPLGHTASNMSHLAPNSPLTQQPPSTTQASTSQPASPIPQLSQTSVVPQLPQISMPGSQYGGSDSAPPSPSTSTPPGVIPVTRPATTASRMNTAGTSDSTISGNHAASPHSHPIASTSPQGASVGLLFADPEDALSSPSTSAPSPHSHVITAWPATRATTAPPNNVHHYAATGQRPGSPSPGIQPEFQALMSTVGTAMNEEMRRAKVGMAEIGPDSAAGQMGPKSIRFTPAERSRHWEVLEMARPHINHLTQVRHCNSLELLIACSIHLDTRLHSLEDSTDLCKEQAATSYYNLEAVFDYLQKLHKTVEMCAPALQVNRLEKVLKELLRKLQSMSEKEAFSMLSGRKMGSSPGPGTGPNPEAEFWKCLSCAVTSERDPISQFLPQLPNFNPATQNGSPYPKSPCRSPTRSALPSRVGPKEVVKELAKIAASTALPTSLDNAFFPTATFPPQNFYKEKRDLLGEQQRSLLYAQATTPTSTTRNTSPPRGE